MKREIKFRAWILEPTEGRPKMVEWYPDFFSDMSEVTGYDSEFPTDETDVILMQYTGLKDKNGKEIYEGDVVKTDHLVIKTGIIEYWEVYHSFEIADILRNGCIGDKYDWSDIEVIGNIYENPELL